MKRAGIFHITKRMFAALAVFLALPAWADEIPPPFGLNWGENSTRVEQLLKGAKATITEKRTTAAYDVWSVEGIVQAGLRRTLFYFQQSQLAEVELQYQSAEWDTAKYDTLMNSIRERMNAKYGPGELIARSKTPVDGNVTQTLVGYKWKQPQSSIQLVYFAAENADQIYRTVSIHYYAR